MDPQQRRAKHAQAADQRERASDHGIGHPPGPTGWRKPRKPPATGNAAVLRRLRKGFPELHGLVLAGKLTAYQAAVAAGLRGRKRQRERPVVVNLSANAITPQQEMELWLGSSHHGSAFSDDEQRRRLWAAHRERLLSWWGTDGRRPQAWWRYDSPIPFPGHARERSVLFEAGLLSAYELETLTATWRADFARAWEPDFFFIAGPGEIYQGAIAREKHFAWADIPSALVQQWEAARQRED
jgi:hypothetical protein